MKCYILRWNSERNTFKQKDFEEFQTDFNNGEEYSFRWEIEQWEEAEKRQPIHFSSVQYCQRRNCHDWKIRICSV